MEWKIKSALDITNKKTYMAHIDTMQELKELLQKYNKCFVDFFTNEITIYDYYIDVE